VTEWWQIVECTGRTVLDIGGYDGGWGAKPALEHGALSAVVVDNGEWKKYGWQEPGIEHPAIVYINEDFFEYDTPADIVIAGNVIYHLRDPIVGLKHLRKLTRESLVVKTSTVTPAEAGPDGWRWYENGEGHENMTVWARPTEEGLRRSLSRAGFRDVREVDQYGGFIVVCRP